MNPVDFRRQIFRDSAQWNHGLRSKLKPLDGGGVELFSRPIFTDWVIQSAQARGVRYFAIDPCGRIFWIHPQSYWLYRYDPINGAVEAMISLAEESARKKQSFRRILSMERRLWILDRKGSRLISLRTDTFQIIGEIPLSHPIDIAWGAGRLYSLDRNGIAAYDVNGRVLSPPRREHLESPVALCADPRGEWIYVIDACRRSFRRFRTDGSFQDEIGNFDDVAADFRPRLLGVNPGGNLFICEGKRNPIIHEFSPDGGYIGSTDEISPFTRVRGMTFSPSGDLYVGAPEGIARLADKTGLAGKPGEFYSGTLDSGGDGSDCWHRLDLIADLDAGGAVDVFYASDDDPALSAAVNAVIERNAPASEKVDAIEVLLGDRWEGPDELQTFSATETAEAAASHGDFRERTTHSVLFRKQTKRYLWLKLKLSGLAPGAKAAVREMRVYYPRLSYLRYLPAVYQEDPASREFLQRFLSMFETVFSGLEATVERIPELFDPEHTPKEFLDWLAQWLNLGMEEDWSSEVKSRLIRQAASLYQKKGRPDGLAEFIEIVTAKRPVIQESFETERPFVLGESSYLGFGMRVSHRPTAEVPSDQRTVLGLSQLGTSRLRNTTQISVNPFRAGAHHFNLLLDLSLQEYQRHERSLRRILRENSPAHVGYDIRLVSGMGMGPGMALEVNSRVEDPQPLYLGHSTLGRSVLSGFRYGPELGIDATLAGDACASNGAAAVFYGE
jgi:phage tail-like protein